MWLQTTIAEIEAHLSSAIEFAANVRFRPRHWANGSFRPIADITGWVNRNPRIGVATMVKVLMSTGQFVGIYDRSAFEATTTPSVLQRLLSRRGVTLLARNTVVSILTFVVGVALMLALVELAGANKVFSAGASFLAETSLLFAFVRGWVFPGAERGVAL